MYHLFTRKTAARIFFIIGLLFVILGCAFLPGSKIHISRHVVLISLLFLVIGVGCAIAAIKLYKNAVYLFFAAYSLLAGLFFLLSSLDILPLPFSRAWPLLSVFSGIALIPAGWYRYEGVRIKYIVPSLFFIVLGSVLLVFSLDLVSFSLAQFVRDWWPLLIVLWGLILTLVSLGSKKPGI
ncbi:MAG: hypothetical protein LBH44_03010 [Treponema sp.]|jgi:hypothetical protein|nr:hypothetical protein [Treponema sp.]